jgi:starvation-inducible DNA-binding protein
MRCSPTPRISRCRPSRRTGRCAGPNFIALHKLFDDVYEHAGEWADTIAERVAALGGQPKGTLQEASKNTRLDAYPVDLVADREHVARFSMSLGKFGSNLRSAIEQFTRDGDLGSADLVTEMSREVDKDLWFVEAHWLKADRADAPKWTYAAGGPGLPVRPRCAGPVPGGRTRSTKSSSQPAAGVVVVPAGDAVPAASPRPTLHRGSCPEATCVG